MDLAEVLACGTDRLGHDTLAAYYADLFASVPGDYPGAFRVRAALHFGVQQLATRSRMAREREQFLQIGGFSTEDLPAALIQAMPHTRVTWTAGASRLSAPRIDAAMARQRARLPGDAMPEEVVLAETVPDAPGCFGLIAVLSEGEAPDLAPWRGLLNPVGRILLAHRAGPTVEPVLRLHDADA